MGITIESLRRSTTHLQISDNDLDPSNDSSVAVENNSSRYEGPSRSDGVVGEGEVFIEDVNEGDVTEVNPQTAGRSLRIPSPEIEAEDMTSLMLEFEQEHRRKVAQDLGERLDWALGLILGLEETVRELKHILEDELL